MNSVTRTVPRASAAAAFRSRPYSAPCLMPQIRLSTATSDSAALARSMRPGLGSLYSGNRKGPSTSSSNITGTPARNTAPHQNHSINTPPTTGPMIAPTEKLVIQMEIAKVRCLSSRNIDVISESVEGASVAPAIPRAARAMISCVGVCAKAATTDITPNAAAPISRIRRRPNRSPRAPITIRKPATMNP